MNTTLLKAKKAYISKKYKKASFLYEKILEAEPTNIEILIDLCDCFYNLSKNDIYRRRAIEVAKKIIDLVPNNPNPYITLSLLSSANSIYNQRKYAEKAIELDPNLPEAISCYGLVLLHENQTDEAIFYLEKAIKLDPKLYLANYNLLVAYTTLKDIQKQFIQSQKIFRLKPNIRNLTILLGLFFAKNRFLYLLFLLLPLLFIWLPNNFLFITHLLLLFLSIYGIFSAIRHKAKQHLERNILLTLKILSLDFLIFFLVIFNRTN